MGCIAAPMLHTCQPEALRSVERLEDFHDTVGQKMRVPPGPYAGTVAVATMRSRNCLPVRALAPDAR